MKKGFLAVFLILGLAVIGCGAYSENVAGEKPDAAGEKNYSKQRLEKENEKLALENKVLAENNAAMTKKANLLENMVKAEALDAEISRTRMAAIEAILKAAEEREEKSGWKLPPELAIQRPIIKILGGNGDISLARAAGAELVNQGYNVARIDWAPDDWFSSPKVFYAESFKLDAEKIAVLLGPPTIVRPLTWPSIFDIIIVTVPPDSVSGEESQ